MLISLWFAVLHSSHTWGFPRRWLEFGGQPDVDVQTCTVCGARRISPVQFGPADRAHETEQPEARA